MKLILVITGSALIICFCHKLTNYKKSRRYKSNSLSTINQHDFDRGYPPASIVNGTSTTALQQTIAPHLLAYDPYNTIRPFNCQPDFTGLTGSAHHLTNAYGYHHSGGPLYNTHFNQVAAVDGGTSSTQQPHQTTLIANPIYSTNLAQPGDCSSFRAQLIEQSPEQDVCPSYEEAIAASNNIFPIATTTVNIHNNNSSEQLNQSDDRQQQLDETLASASGSDTRRASPDLYPSNKEQQDEQQSQSESQSSSSPVFEQQQRENDFINDEQAHDDGGANDE